VRRRTTFEGVVDHCVSGKKIFALSLDGAVSRSK
jgi:hypothetical protein